MKRELFIGLVVISVLLLGCATNSTTKSTSELNAVATGLEARMFKSPNCGCCGIYSQYITKEGLNVKVENVADLTPIKDQYKIPAELRSCHTTIIGNYFVEGHIPAEAIEKLLREKPDIAGIALPGMPSGTPGMPGPKTEPWIIRAIHKDGTVTEFMRL